jgi:hypothetical protein
MGSIRDLVKEQVERAVDQGCHTLEYGTPWSASPLRLYDNLSKHCATALIHTYSERRSECLYRTFFPPCGRGWQAQTVRHVQQQRVDLISSEAFAAAFWSNSGQRTPLTNAEDIAEYAPFQALE